MQKWGSVKDKSLHYLGRTFCLVNPGDSVAGVPTATAFVRWWYADDGTVRRRSSAINRKVAAELPRADDPNLEGAITKLYQDRRLVFVTELFRNGFHVYHVVQGIDGPRYFVVLKQTLDDVRGVQPPPSIHVYHEFTRLKDPGYVVQADFADLLLKRMLAQRTRCFTKVDRSLMGMAFGHPKFVSRMGDLSGVLSVWDARIYWSTAS